MSSVKITVVIATCNRVSSLRNCLSSLEEQTLDRALFEVLVINDGSTDATGQFLDTFVNETLIRFRYISQKNSGVSYSRNLGIDNAEGEFVAFTDDDCIVPPDWLEKMYHRIDSADKEVAGIGGPLDCVTEQKGTFISNFIQFIDEFNYIPVLTGLVIWYRHTSQLKGDERVPYLRTSNALFRKHSLKEVGGFDVAFRRPGGEDPDLCYRLLNHSYRFLFDRDLVVLHNSRDSLTAFFKSLRNYLEGEIKTSRKSHLYNNMAVRRSYQYILLRKSIRLGQTIITFPFSVVKMLWKRRYSVAESVSFPFIILLSKIYAFFLSAYFQARYVK